MGISFRRITSSGGFMPEIDGLRFIAIASVVLFHTHGFIVAKDPTVYSRSPHSIPGFHALLSHGHLGVPLFFVISGFILGLPFARARLSSANPINLGSYFFRRLTRLEPPYIIAMSLLLAGALFVARSLAPGEALRSFLASVTYTHNFLYGRDVLPRINPVAWSLEIEVQFYLLAPLLSLIFVIHKPRVRRWILVGSILALLAVNQMVELPFVCIFEWMHYFLIGLLLVDLHVTGDRLFSMGGFDALMAWTSFISIWVFDQHSFESHLHRFLWATIQAGCIFTFYHCVLLNRQFRFLTRPWVTNVGGMCYTIYLLHYAIISMVGNRLVLHRFSGHPAINTSIYALILVFFIMTTSSLFFLAIERPCMDRNWAHNLFRIIRQRFSPRPEAQPQHLMY